MCKKGIMSEFCSPVYLCRDESASTCIRRRCRFDECRRRFPGAGHLLQCGGRIELFWRSMSTPTIDQDLEVLFSREQIATRVAELGAEISRDFAGQNIMLVGVLKGAAIFLADLARSISVDCTFD